MSNTDNFVFTSLKVIFWVIFIGLSIEAGGLVVNFFFSLFNPQFVQNLYQRLDLSEIYGRSKWAYFGMYSFVLAISILKAVLIYKVILLLSKIDLNKPFSLFVSRQISQISSDTLAIGILSFIARQAAKNLTHKGFATDNLDQFWTDSQAFVMMAAVLYVISTIFKKGLEIQNENELTV